MSSIPVPARTNGTPSTSRSSLPTFEPLSQRRSKSRDGRPESSASGSNRSQSNGKSKERIVEVTNSSSAINAQVDTESPKTKTHSRRTSHRSSGGFLLGSIRRSSRIPRLSSGDSEDPKGKRKSEDSPPLSVPKTRARHVQTQSGSSIASSPLATEIHPDSITSNGNGRLTPGTDVPKPVDISRPQTTSSGKSSGQHLEIRRPSPPVFGYDTDPSQIVNMALSLSEARRRQASMKRYASNDQQGRRVVSTASANSNRSSRIPTGSIAQYISPTPARPPSATPSIDNKPLTSHAISRGPLLVEGSPSDDMDLPDSVPLDEAEISEATAARVQRAKTYFELAYEHRRILPHLPPVRRPGAYIRSTELDSQTKAYNPLQYVRNRKLRIWDKTTFDAEADGWHDTDKVKKWVDAVIDGHHEARNDPVECVRLPPLSLSEKPSNDRGQNDTGERQPQQNGASKPRRPRSDWITHPGDMLADCFWLEQGVNKIKIRDRDNNQIYPPDTHFRFSGWRNRAPVSVPDNLQQPTPPESDEEPIQVHEPLHSPIAELPTFKSAHHTGRGKPHHRGSRRLKESLAAMEDSGNKRKGLRLFMDDTSDEEESEQSPGSPGGDRERGRKRLMRKRQRRRSTSPSPGAEPLSTTHTKDSIFASTLSSDKSQPSSAQHSKRTSFEQSRFSQYLKRDSNKGHTPLSRSQNRAEHNRHESSTKFPSFHDRPRSSAEYDSTAPNSPVAAVFPSIAINLESPPQSRSPSPHKKKASILNPFRDRAHGKHDMVSATDFADLSQAGSRQTSGDGDKHHSDSSPGASRGTSPMTRGQSPLSKGPPLATQSDSTTAAADHRGSTISRVSTKSAAPSSDHSKIRGMFKGGRIAELVGHEVSRVGEFIWKREPPLHRRRGSGSSASTRSLHESDTDDGQNANGDVFKTPKRPKMRSRRASTLSSTKSEQFTSPVSSKSPPSAERPKFHNPNLPSFTSPFEKDKEAQDQKKQALLTPTSSPSDERRDHISRLAAEHRSTSRSPRLDKLAPPKLDTGRTASPMGLKHQNSYGFGESLALQRSLDASDKFNSAISIDASGLRNVKSATDLTRISTAELPVQPEEPQNVTRRDIDRAIALLLCSAVKAREIGRRADLPRDKAPGFLLESLAADGVGHSHVDLSLVSRREEHVVAARMVMSQLSTQAAAFDDKMKHFSSITAPALHRGLQELEDLVDNKLTPRVRTSADEAGELSIKLSTTSTMAIKGLNDAIDSAIRRRRRGPIRWVRRLWYASIEYTVVSLLWGIWAVVTLIRIVMAVFTGTTRTVRWLLWID